MKRITCKNCGEIFRYDDNTPTEGLKDMAKDIIPGAALFMRGPKLCPECRRADSSESSVSISNERSENNGMSVQQQKELMAKEAKLEQKKQQITNREQITNLQFPDDANAIQFILNSLVSRVAGMPKVFKSWDDRKMLKIIKEKLEFGIMKLRSMGNNEEADYFQTKLDKMK